VNTTLVRNPKDYYPSFGHASHPIHPTQTLCGLPLAEGVVTLAPYGFIVDCPDCTSIIDHVVRGFRRGETGIYFYNLHKIDL
jgi:hypothetical protein